MINLNKIELKNFGSFDEQAFDFHSGKYLIVGQNNSSPSLDNNGSGKSLLFESIPFAIYGNTPRFKDVSRNHEGKCCVKLSFNIGENEYRIERYYKDEKFGNKVKLFCNEEEDISCKNIGDTEKQIIALGFPPYDLFISTITVLQGMPINFSQVSNVQRKEILEELFGFSIWESYRNKIKKQLTIYKANKDIIETNYTDNKEKVIALSSKIETFKIANRDSLDQVDKEIDEITGTIKTLKDQYFIIEEKYKDMNFDPKAYEKTQQEYNNYQYELRNYEKIGDVGKCPTCGQAYPAEKIEEAVYKMNKFKGKLTELSLILQEQKDIKEQYDARKKEMDTTESKILLHKENFRKLIRKKEDSVSNNLGNISELESQLDSLLVVMNDFKFKLTEMENKIKYTMYIDNLLLPSSSFRTSIMEQYLTYVNSIVESISPTIFDDLKIRLVIDEKGKGIDIQLHKGKLSNLDYKELSGGEKKRLDIILILSLQKFLLESSGIDINLIVFDEIFDTLDSKGIENVVNCLNYMYAEDICIYIISHNNALKNMFENIYTIQKNQDISTVL